MIKAIAFVNFGHIRMKVKLDGILALWCSIQTVMVLECKYTIFTTNFIESVYHLLALIAAVFKHKFPPVTRYQYY